MTTLLERCIKEDFGLIETPSRFAKSVTHSSLVYDRVKDRFYWNSAGIFGNLYDYLLQVRNMDVNSVGSFVRHYKDKAPESSLEQVLSCAEEPVQLPALVKTFYEKGKNVRDYWYNTRGYTDKTIDDFMLGWTGEWFCIPIFVNGEFKNLQLRRENPKKISQWYRGTGHLPFNFSILNYTDWVVITESPVDAIMLRQNDIPAVSQNLGAGAWNISWNPRFMRLKKLYIVYDNDDAGNSGSLNVAKNFGYKAKIFNFFDFPDKFDVTDYFKAGAQKKDFMDLLLTESVTYDKLQGKGK
jgi:hypothetical protein